MSLSSALQIGRSALTASQLAIQVTGDNLANAATPGFSRRVATLTPALGGNEGRNINIGRGVEIQAVNRQIDAALQNRLRDSGSHTQAALVDQQVLSQIENSVSDLDGEGLSSQLNKFLGTFSELANNPSASETRSLIVEQGKTLAGFVRNLRSGLLTQRDQVDASLATNVNRADDLLNQIAGLNQTITTSEQGGAQNASLRDRRDALVTELGGLIDVSTVEQPSGALDVYVGSTPVLQGTNSRGLELRTRTVNNELQVDVIVSKDQQKLEPKSGAIGGLLAQRSGALESTIDSLDTFSSALIFEVNKIHSSGRSFPGLTSTTGELKVAPADQTLAFNDPTNTTFANLPFHPSNGSFSVYVTDKSTGLVQKREIPVDLDGIDNTGAAGFSNDTSLSSLVASLNTIPNLSAQVTTDGRLQIDASPGFEVGFADDTSGALATLGVNTFFSGKDAADIDVRQELSDNPLLVVAGIQEGSNEAARAIAALRDTGVASLGGASLGQAWQQTTDSIAVASSAASTRASATGQVQQSLEAQRAAVSGVSVDEESINLINYQRQYQAAARFITTVDQLTQILLTLV